MNYNYSEFKQHILCNLQERLGSDTQITVQDIIKNNDTHLDGLTILSAGQNLSPTIYLNHYYNQYTGGKLLSEIEDDILDIYHNNRLSNTIDVSFFTNYDKVKSHIVFKLINYERNHELLQQVPHYHFLDLAVVFICLLTSSSSDNSAATILIYNHHLNYWNITNDDLYTLAKQNTPKLLTYDLRNMTDVLKELFSIDYISNNVSEEIPVYPIYVLTNQYKLNGSSCILYHNLLQDFANHLNCDLFILPSSVHEVLIIPVKNQTTSQELSNMVKDVNSSQLSREEVLSDHVYYFSRESGQITM